MIKGLVKRFKKGPKTAKNAIQPVIIPRAEHSISRASIHPNALKVLYRLNNARYGAFLVGGCVRDLLLGRQPKDFDIATDAEPDEIRQLFKNCRLIGKRFRLAHIVFGKDIIEVATFRTHHENAEHEAHAKTHHGMIVRDNVYGSIEDDIFRRDFTINGLYYNIADFSILDFANGMEDIKTQTLRMIGDPHKRYLEDPVRMLRAIRFMGKLSLSIAPETEQPIFELSHLLLKVSSARLYLEVVKLFQEGATLPTFRLLCKYKLFKELFPVVDMHLHEKESVDLIEAALASTDQRIQENKTVSPAFIFSVFVWPIILKNLKAYEQSKLPPYVAHEKAAHHAIESLTERLAIPRFLLVTIREICILQFRFTQRFGQRPYRLLTHPRYRAAYDLLLLRGTIEPISAELGQWWTQFSEASDADKIKILKEVEKKEPYKKKFKKKKKVVNH